MNVSPQQTNKKDNSLTFSILLGILWALFWAIDGTLAYMLFGGASFFLALFFYKQLIKKESTNDPRHQTGDNLFSKTRTHKQTGTAQSPYQKTLRSRQFRFSVTVVVLLVMVYALIRFTKYTPEDDPYVLLELGDQKYNEGEYDSAYYYYKLILQKQEDKAEAWLGLGNVLYMQDKKDSALLLYEKASVLDPNYTQARYNIGWWYYNQKQYKESITQLESLVSDDSSQLGAMQMVGDSFYELAEYDSAMRWYEGAYVKGARSRWLCHVMAYLHDRNNALDKAIPLYKEALQYDSTLVAIYIRLGELLPGKEGEDYRFKAAELQLR